MLTPSCHACSTDQPACFRSFSSIPGMIRHELGLGHVPGIKTISRTAMAAAIAVTIMNMHRAKDGAH